MLLKNSSHKKSIKKTYFIKTILKNSTSWKLKSFDLIQIVFKNSQFLTHFNLIRQFFINVNVFKDDFEIFVYHLRRENIAKLIAIESIVFLSKILTQVEKLYWSTELKVTTIVWVIKKLHHMIRAFRHFTMIWTNHSITTLIVKQIKMITSNSNKLNSRLVRVDMYLSQFNLDIKHKSERNHVISNALSRLSSWNDDEEKITKNSNNNILNDINTYCKILIKMSSKFKNRFVQDYKKNK
jgi:hypothetical protein